MSCQCKDIKMSDIKISEQFKSSFPSRYKLAERLAAYETGELFTKYDIVVNENNVLVDGYITYLTLLNVGYSGTVAVKVQKSNPRVYVFAKHSPEGKEYVWKIPQKFGTEIKIKPGDTVIARTKYGNQEATVTKVEVLDRPPISCKIRTLAKW